MRRLQPKPSSPPASDTSALLTATSPSSDLADLIFAGSARRTCSTHQQRHRGRQLPPRPCLLFAHAQLLSPLRQRQGHSRPAAHTAAASNTGQRQALSSSPPGTALRPPLSRYLFRQRRLNAQIETANPHRLRHTFGSDMARCGVRLPILQKMMGHADSKTTLQYINLSMADIAQEFERAAVEIHKRYAGR